MRYTDRQEAKNQDKKVYGKRERKSYQGLKIEEELKSNKNKSEADISDSGCQTQLYSVKLHTLSSSAVLGDVMTEEELDLTDRWCFQ